MNSTRVWLLLFLCDTISYALVSEFICVAVKTVELSFSSYGNTALAQAMKCKSNFVLAGHYLCVCTG